MFPVVFLEAFQFLHINFCKLNVNLKEKDGLKFEFSLDKKAGSLLKENIAVYFMSSGSHGVWSVMGCMVNDRGERIWLESTCA
jgi:hypothetical protein